MLNTPSSRRSSGDEHRIALSPGSGGSSQVERPVSVSSLLANHQRRPLARAGVALAAAGLVIGLAIVPGNSNSVEGAGTGVPGAAGTVVVGEQSLLLDGSRFAAAIAEIVPSQYVEPPSSSWLLDGAALQEATQSTLEKTQLLAIPCFIGPGESADDAKATVSSCSDLETLSRLPIGP